MTSSNDTEKNEAAETILKSNPFELHHKDPVDSDTSTHRDEDENKSTEDPEKDSPSSDVDGIASVSQEADEGADLLDGSDEPSASAILIDFDPTFYLATYRDVAASGMDPLTHYLNHGQAEGRLPRALLDSDGEPLPVGPSEAEIAARDLDPTFYLATYPDVAASGMDPLTHYLDHGHAEGRLPRAPESTGKPLPVGPSEAEIAAQDLDPKFYMVTYPDVAASGMDPLTHYLNHGHAEGRYRSDRDWFAAQAAGLDQMISRNILDIIPIIDPDRPPIDENNLSRFIFYMFDAEFYRRQIKSERYQSRVQLLTHFIISGMPAGLSPGPLFDAEHYLNALKERGAYINLKKTTPFEHWLSYGVENRISPNPFYSDAAYVEINKDLLGYPGWVFEHFLRHGMSEARQFNPSIRLSTGALANFSSPTKTGSRQFYSDVAKLSSFANVSESLARFAAFTQSKVSDALVADARALDPEVGTLKRHMSLSLLPPYHDSDYLDYKYIREQLPEGTFENIILIPFCKLGGSDYVSGLLARSVAESGRTLILRTEQSDWARPDWFPSDVESVDLSPYLKVLPETTRTRILYTLFQEIGTSNIININSRAAFLTFDRFGKQLSFNRRLHAYYFCADRDPDGVEVGYPVWYFPNILKHLTSALTDSEQLRAQLCDRYNLTEELAARVHAVYTPAMTKVPPAPIAIQQVESRAQRRRPVILWGGRLDRQKRFDLLVTVAERMPDIDFKCWGKAVLDEAPDLSRLPRNVTLHPPFKHLEDLPLGNADGWLYTSEWDGVPTILIECAALGMPIVASAVGGVPELIDDETGWPVQAVTDVQAYIDAIGDMLKDGEDRIARSRALQARIRARHQFSIYQDRLSSIITG